MKKLEFLNTEGKSDTKQVREIANYICNRLNCLGYHILRYDAPHSTYLKIDGGVCHSIRISNHKSNKTHLSYRYNIMIDGILDNDYVTKDNKGYIKYYARAESVNKIISLIENNRRSCIRRHGKLEYYCYILKILKMNRNKQQGFWFKSKTVFSTNNTKIEYKNEIYIDRITRIVLRLYSQYKKDCI